jgi:hypothetical protein
VIPVSADETEAIEIEEEPGAELTDDLTTEEENDEEYPEDQDEPFVIDYSPYLEEIIELLGITEEAEENIDYQPLMYAMITLSAIITVLLIVKKR